jgi:hypothetical protein
MKARFTYRAAQASLFCLVTAITAPGVALAQDDALEKLLKEAEQKATPGDKPAADKGSSVGKEDAGLDDLLKKLGGGSGDKPLPKGEAKPGPGDQPAPDEKPSQPGSTLPKPAGGLAGLKSRPDAELDQRLEEILGRKRKKPNEDQDQQSGGQGQGEGSDSEPQNPAMKKLVEQMRDVEKRLSETDTGQETRNKQKEIVESIDQMIERMRQMAQQQQQQRQRRQQQQQQGQEMAQNQEGEQPGSQAGGVGLQKPLPPAGKSSLGGKDVWGHLPPELRDVMRNVFREESLPAREELVRRYYLSVSKKSLARSPNP